MPKVKKPKAAPVGPMVEGTWPADDIRRAFVAGAKWWEYESCGATMWQSDRNKAKDEANKRYPGGKYDADVFNSPWP